MSPKSSKSAVGKSSNPEMKTAINMLNKDNLRALRSKVQIREVVVILMIRGNKGNLRVPLTFPMSSMLTWTKTMMMMNFKNKVLSSSNSRNNKDSNSNNFKMNMVMRMRRLMKVTCKCINNSSPITNSKNSNSPTLLMINSNSPLPNNINNTSSNNKKMILRRRRRWTWTT